MTIIVDKLPFLTPKQFDWAVEEMDLKPSDYQRLYQAMVDGKPVPELAVEVERTPQALYLQIRRTLAELERRLQENNKSIVMVFVDNEAVGDVRALETL